MTEYRFHRTACYRMGVIVLISSNAAYNGIEESLSMYESLTRYITEFEGSEFGSWVKNEEKEGTAEHPIQIPFVSYTRAVLCFLADADSFVQFHKEIGLTRYSDILRANGIEWEHDSMAKAEAGKLDAESVPALIIGAIRADRFCEGAQLAFLRDGSVVHLLERLKELDKSTEGV